MLRAALRNSFKLDIAAAVASRHPLRNEGKTRSRDSVAVSVGLLFTGLLGAAQALLIVFIAGEGSDTDAFLAAYSVYVPFALFGISLRRTLVPLIGASLDEEGLRARAEEHIARVILLAGGAGAVLFAASPLLVLGVGAGLPGEARSTMLTALLILIPAVCMQIVGGAMSATLTAAKRFPLSMLFYVVASMVAVSASAALLAMIGVVGAALGVLSGSLVLVATHAAYLRRFRVRPRPRVGWLRSREQGRLALLLLAGAALGMANQLSLTIAVSAVSAEVSGIIVYSYAFFLVGLMLNLTSYPLSLVTLPDVVEAVAARGRDAAREQLNEVIPYLFAVLVPMAVGLVVFGEPLLRLIFQSALSPESIQLMHDIASVLCVMVIFTSLYVLAGTTLLALQRWRGALLVGSSSIVLHLVAIRLLSSGEPSHVAVAHAAASATVVAVLLAVLLGRTAVRWTLMAIRQALPALAFSVVFVLWAALISGSPSLPGDASAGLALAGLFASLVTYAALVGAAWPTVSAPFLGLCRQARAGALRVGGRLRADPPVE